MSEKFLALGLQPDLVKALDEMNFVQPTPIQEQTIPAALKGDNVVGRSATGTGKTLAYLLPILQKIDPESSAVQAVILAPTYELAMQISHQVQLVVQKAEMKITSLSLIGGANVTRQIEKLKKKPQIVIGSAGRINELQRKGKLKMQQVKFLVLDEVDRLLDDQNQESIEQVLKCIGNDCQHFLFSATIAAKTMKRASFVLNPTVVKLGDDLILQPQIENFYFITTFRDKIEVLRKLTKLFPVKRGLVFVNKMYDLGKTMENLKFNDIKVAALTGDADKLSRKKAVDDFTKGKVTLLLATDLAARGLDIPDIDYVINLDIPENDGIYLHRAGRTGRAGTTGIAVSLVDSKEVTHFVEIGKKLNLRFVPKKMLNGKIVDFIVKPKHWK